jgi:hypothetical protein
MVWSYYSNIAHGSTYSQGAYGHAVDFDHDDGVDYRSGLVKITEKTGRWYMAKRCTYDGHLHHEDEVGYKDNDGNWFSSWQNMKAFKNPEWESLYSATNTKLSYASRSRRYVKRRKEKKKLIMEKKIANESSTAAIGCAEASVDEPVQVPQVKSV